MAKTDLNIIKNWFKTGLKPTQAQFWTTWDSFWHKDEKLPISSIENLGNILDNKAENNHTHNEYATNDATSLNEENVSSWRSSLGIKDVELTDETVKLTQSYEDFGIEAGSSQSLLNQTFTSELFNRVEIPEENADSDHVLLADGSTLAKTELGSSLTVMGIASDENKNIDISNVAMDWKNPSQKFSGLQDKSNDATYDKILVSDSEGNINTSKFNLPTDDYIPLTGTEEGGLLTGTITANIEDIRKPILYVERGYSPITFAEHFDEGYGKRNKFSASRDGIILESQNTNTGFNSSFRLSEYGASIIGVDKAEIAGLTVYGDGLIDAPNLTDSIIDTSESSLITRRYLESHGVDTSSFLNKYDNNTVNSNFRIYEETNAFAFNSGGLTYNWRGSEFNQFMLEPGLLVLSRNANNSSYSYNAVMSDVDFRINRALNGQSAVVGFDIDGIYRVLNSYQSQQKNYLRIPQITSDYNMVLTINDQKADEDGNIKLTNRVIHIPIGQYNYTLDPTELTSSISNLVFGLDADGTITLPTTGVTEGQELTIINTSNDVTVTVANNEDNATTVYPVSTFSLVFISGYWYTKSYVGL